MSGATAGVTALAAGAASALGAGVSAYANNQAMRKQDRIAAEGIRKQGQLQDQANQITQQTIQKNATQEQQNLQTNKQKQEAAYLDALRRAAPTQNASNPATPGASKAYAKAVTDATASNAAFGRQQAGLMATTDAPTLTNNQTQLSLGDAATQLGQLSDTSSRQNNLTELQARAVQANPWLLAAGQFISGAGAGAAGSYKKKPAYSYGSGAGQGIMADSGLAQSVGGLA